MLFSKEIDENITGIIDKLPNEDSDENLKEFIVNSLNFLLSKCVKVFDKASFNQKLDLLRSEKLMRCFNHYVSNDNRQKLAVILGFFYSALDPPLPDESKAIFAYLFEIIKYTEVTPVLLSGLDALVSLSYSFSSSLIKVKKIDLLVNLLKNSGFISCIM
jgi:hypothetical protein